MSQGPALYIHVPFCVRKCYYCDFASQPYTSPMAEGYVSALEQEAEHYLTSWPQGQEVPSVYIGGGTPTVLTPQELERVLQVAAAFPRVAGAEWTVEANPGTLTKTKLALLKAAGVNRLSLGVQSFDDDLLVFLGRIHTASEAKTAWDQARRAGFDNLSLDLMYAIPGQSLKLWRQTLQEALALAPEHISTYSLMIEEGTEFARRALEPCPEELDLAQYREAQTRLEQAGLSQYEISNFARPGYACQHNLVYWHNEPYLGLGPAATSYLAGERRTNIRDTISYVDSLGQGCLPIAERELATPELAQAETVILALRLREGLSRPRFARQFGRDVYAVFPQAIDRLMALGLVTMDEFSLSLTAKGLLLANQVALEFLPNNFS
ncbi:MAG: radical SAM family heme chaperone HemW [Firmicutes bacterium]|nr:radical SAM family heme chaperone HemW [Bacillota bacterium]